MRRVRSAIFTILMSCITTVALAAPANASAPATTTPATATDPAPASASVTVDRSTPKAAAVTLFRAITAGDRDVVAAGFYATGAEHRALARAMAEVIVAGKRLGDAAREQFGDAGDPIGRGMLDPADLAKLEDATVLETAPDAAVMTVPGQPRPMSFRRQDGQWKLVVTDFAGAADENLTKQTRLVRAMADTIDTAAADVAAGKYKTPDQATFAIQQSLHQVMLSFYRPSTTRSATNPAATPPPAPRR